MLLIPLALLCGLLVAQAAGPELRQHDEPPWRDRFVLALAIYGGLLLVPIALYLHLLAPDWAWLYLMDARALGRLASTGLALGLLAAALLGSFAAGRMLALRRRPRALWGALAAAAVAAAAIGGLATSRLGRVGTLAEVRAGGGVGLGRLPVGVALPLALLGAAIAAGILVVQVRRSARRSVG